MSNHENAFRVIVAEMRTSASCDGIISSSLLLRPLPPGECSKARSADSRLKAMRMPPSLRSKNSVRSIVRVEVRKHRNENVRTYAYSFLCISFFFRSFVCSFITSFISSPPNADFARFYAGFNSPVSSFTLSPLLSPATVLEGFRHVTFGRTCGTINGVEWRFFND